jgi:hypothetical protein
MDIDRNVADDEDLVKIFISAAASTCHLWDQKQADKAKADDNRR